MNTLPLKLPAFGEADYKDAQVNADTRAFLLHDADESRFADYCAALLQADFALKEQRRGEALSFAAFESAGRGVFINYFHRTRQLQLIIEENTRYFSYQDPCGATITAPQLTQLKLKDYGMTYVLRLSDGRFLVIDGGRPFPEDADRLFEVMKAGADGERPVIAAWLITHPHCDHMYGCFPFFERYGAEVTIQKFMFCFPDAEDFAQYPALADPAVDYPGNSTCQMQKAFLALVNSLNVPVYSPLTGQCYTLGDAQLEILAGIADTCGSCSDLNATSLVLRVSIAGQTILFGGDAHFGEAQLASRYGTQLKSDLLQIPHHGFGAGAPEDEIAAYKMIAPSVCLLSASYSESYALFSTYISSTEFLMRKMDIGQLFAGGQTHTLDLPFTPAADGKADLERQFIAGRQRAGGQHWLFEGLNTAEDLPLTAENITYVPSKIELQLTFADGKTVAAEFTLAGSKTQQLPLPLEGIAHGSAYSLRLECSVPLKITLGNRAPSHCSNNL